MEVGLTDPGIGEDFSQASQDHFAIKNILPIISIFSKNM